MSRTVFKGGRVFDGTGAPIFAADVAVEDGRFAEVGEDLRGDQQVDVAGKVLLPGLFDCHVHVLGVRPEVAAKIAEPFSYQFYIAIRNLGSLLDCGITTIRDCAGADLGVKQALEDGIIEGPRIQISVTALSQTGGHMDPWLPSGECVNPYYIAHPGRPGSIVDGPDEVRFAARASVRAGADFIKVLTTDGFTTDPRRSHFQLDELEVLVEEAQAAGKPLVAHAIGSAGAKNALRLGGFRSIEHGAYLDDEAVELLVKSGTWLVPTLFREPEDFVAPDDVEFDVDRDHSAALYSETSFHDEHEASFKRALAAGAKIAMGTDFGNDCGENLMQLWKMHELGMPAEQVLVSATSSAAELMDLGDELGTIAAGKRADLVVVDGDPYDFRTLKQSIRAVYQDGVKVRG